VASGEVEVSVLAVRQGHQPPLRHPVAGIVNATTAQQANSFRMAHAPFTKKSLRRGVAPRPAGFLANSLERVQSNLFPEAAYPLLRSVRAANSTRFVATAKPLGAERGADYRVNRAAVNAS
jgi:hypothetical protein